MATLKNLAFAILATAAIATQSFAQDRFDVNTPFSSSITSLDFTVSESMVPIHAVTLKLRYDDAGKLHGELTFDPNRPHFDEFGAFADPPADAKPSEIVKLDCTLKFEKETPERRLYSIRGKDISSKLSFSYSTQYGFGDLLVHGRDGKVRYVISMVQPQPVPCHPGCFPKGSLVLVGDETRPIEELKIGDEVTVLDAEGKPSLAKIVDRFMNINKLIEVRTESGNLITTETQPIALDGGDFRPAGELVAGDMILRFIDSKPSSTKVTEIAAFKDRADVFNLVLGEPTIFVVNEFQVKSKPPEPIALP